MNTELARTPVILLAGGKSERMGQPKGLVDFNGRPWVDEQLARLGLCGIREAWLVLGYHAETYRNALPWLAQADASEGVQVHGVRVRSILNDQPQFGPFSSIQAAARSLLQRLDIPPSFWILPIDVPCPDREVWIRLSASSAPVCVPLYQGRGGHPVRVSRDFLKHIMAQPADGPDSRLDHQIRHLSPAAERLEVDDPTILKNLNAPADWK